MQTFSETRIEIILGCMYSGKTTELLRRLNRYESIGKKVMILNHSMDIRTDESIKTHNDQVKSAIKVDCLLPLLRSPEFVNCDVIGIDEAQFFKDDLLDFVKEAEKHNKIIIVAGLDGDYLRNPIGQILSLIPLCDEVVKLTALDMVDKDGSIAIYSKRIVSDNQQIMIGAKDKYLAVSRKNYHVSDSNKDTEILNHIQQKYGNVSINLIDGCIGR